jgi:hypothetical protein
MGIRPQYLSDLWSLKKVSKEFGNAVPIVLTLCSQMVLPNFAKPWQSIDPWMDPISVTQPQSSSLKQKPKYPIPMY